MRFLDQLVYVDGIAQRKREQDTLIKQALREAQDEIVAAHRWPFMMTSGAFFTVDAYETGTVTVTNGSRTLTGASTTFTRLMVGRKFRLTRTSPVYVVSGFTSTTVLTLDRPYDGSTASTQAYLIYQDEYLLPADLEVSKLFRDQSGPQTVDHWDVSDFDLRWPETNATGRTAIVLHTGRTLLPFTHQTGTISLDSGSRTVTGSSTSWLTTPQGLSRGSELRVGTAVYHVRSVDSDTQLTLYETATATVSGSSDWAVVLNNPVVQVWPEPDSNRQVLFRYYRKAQPLVADSDTSDIPEQWHWLINLGALKRLFMFTGEIARYQNVVAEYRAGIEAMIESVGSPTMDRTYRLGSLDDAVPGVSRGPRYPANFPDVAFR